MRRENLITVAKAAEMVGRTPATIYNWIKHGRLYTCVGTGSITLVDRDDVARAEAKIKIGRPTGSASSRHWR